MLPGHVTEQLGAEPGSANGFRTAVVGHAQCDPIALPISFHMHPRRLSVMVRIRYRVS
jgi:hypothetical protein